MDICARRTFQTVTKRPMLDAGHPASCRHSRAPYRHQPRAPRFGNQTPPRETNTEIEYPIPGKNYSISTSMGKWKKKILHRSRAAAPPVPPPWPPSSSLRACATRRHAVYMRTARASPSPTSQAHACLLRSALFSLLLLLLLLLSLSAASDSFPRAHVVGCPFPIRSVRRRSSSPPYRRELSYLSS